MQILNTLKIRFENGESLSIPAEDTDYVSIDNIIKNYSFIKPWYHINKTANCDKVYIVIKDNANKASYYNVRYYDDLLPFDRILAFKDILYLEFLYEDGVRESFTVPYNGIDENKLQSVVLNEDNNLVISIEV